MDAEGFGRIRRGCPDETVANWLICGAEVAAVFAGCGPVSERELLVHFRKQINILPGRKDGY